MMAGLAINWQWANPNVVVPQGSRFRTSGAYDAFGDVADSITRVKQSNYREEQNRLARERQEKLDAQAEEDRQRRISEEERVKGIRGQMADRLAGNDRMATTLEGLKARQLELQTAISQIKSKWGI
jgi:hypothetical protein